MIPRSASDSIIATEGSGAHVGTFSMALDSVVAGGPTLKATSLSVDLLEAAVMKAVDKDLMAMTVVEL
jgi:hypothetical protein